MLFLSETPGRRAAAQGSCGPIAVLLAKRRRAATEDSVGERDPFLPAPIPEGSHWDAPGAATDGASAPAPRSPLSARLRRERRSGEKMVPEMLVALSARSRSLHPSLWL